jgi:hypothetical protein
MENKKEGIIKRIVRESGNSKLVEEINSLQNSTYQSLLILSSEDKTSLKSPSQLFSEYSDKQEFFRPSDFSQEELLEFQLQQFSVLKGKFKTIETSPINPQGINSVLTSISQNVSLTTTRNSEVAGDPTTALALEAALLRRKSPESRIDLATSQKVLRMQPFEKDKGYMQHFLLLGLCTAGKSNERFSFLYEAIIKHIEAQLDIFISMNSNGFEINQLEVLLSDISIVEQILELSSGDRNQINRNSLNPDFSLFDFLYISLPENITSSHEISDEELVEAGILDKRKVLERMESLVLKPLRVKYPSIRFGFELSRKAGLGYYDKTCFHIFGVNKDGQKIQLSDGGRVNWTAKLLGDRKELCVISGMGTELIYKFFKKN